jgi:hypothetical protein
MPNETAAGAARSGATALCSGPISRPSIYTCAGRGDWGSCPAARRNAQRLLSVSGVRDVVPHCGQYALDVTTETLHPLLRRTCCFP